MPMEVLGEFDVIIVGAGTAGCLLANRPSTDPDCRVVLLEAGGNDDYLCIRVPVGYLYCIGNPRTDWYYETEPEPGLNGRAIRYPRGRVLGGSRSCGRSGRSSTPFARQPPKMGPAADPAAAVAAELRVHGVDALRVIDASISQRSRPATRIRRRR